MLIKPHEMKGRFKPSYIAKSVLDIDFNYLGSKGIKAVLIDLDGTVVSRGSFEVDAKLVKYLKKQKVNIYIATNRPKSRDLKNLKESLNAVDVIHPKGIFMKPFPQFYKQVTSTHNLKLSEVAMIGDRYLQDIFGANLAGLTTILVYKFGESKGFIDEKLSNFEKNYTNKIALKYKELVKT